MRSNFTSLALFTTLLLAGSALPAHADDATSATPVSAVAVSAPQGVPTGNNSDVSSVVIAPESAAVYANTAAVKFTSRYVLADFAIEGSGKPGFVTDLAHTLDHPIWGWTITGDWWQRYGFAGGHYGTTFKDEHDFTGTGDKPFSLSFCKKGNMEVSGAYYKLAPFKSLKNDVLEFYFEPSCTYDFGGAKITLAVRPMEVVGIDTMPDDFLVRFRAPVTFERVPFLRNATVMLDPIDITINTQPNGGNASSYRPSASVSWDLTDRLSFQAEVQATNHTGTQFSIGLVGRF